jgi:hypothetical protein
MRWLILLGFGLVSCGAAEVQSQKLKDGSLQVTCQLAMDECIRRVQDQCRNQRFRILEGTSETRLRDAPPFERAYHTSRLHLACSDDGDGALLSLGSSSAASASAAPVRPPLSCSKGQTRECIGAGACKGGQTCLPDGSGFGACDCGPAPVAPVPATLEPPSAAPDASAVGSP